MNVNLYLPDDLGQRAKEAELPLSQLLRSAVVDELERRAAVSELLSETKEFMLVIDDDGRRYNGRLVGRELMAEGYGDVSIYLRERDEGVVLYDAGNLKLWEINDPEEDLRDQLEPADYADVMNALGIKPVIDL